MYAVAGVTGNTGSVVADELLRRGRPVRAIVRDESKGAVWAAKGAEVAVASIDDAGALARAWAGVDGVYVLLPPDPASTDFIGRGKAVGDALAGAIRSSGVKHAVLLSSIGAQHDGGTGPIRALHEIEQRLAQTGAAVTFLRPAYFLENWGASLGAAATQGVVPSFLPADFRFPQIATRDIGIAAADALEHPPASGVRVVELAGAEEVTPAEVATVVGGLLGRDVQVAEAPLDAVVPTFTSFGISEHMADLYREMYEGVLNGRVNWDGSGERKRGTTRPQEVFAGMLQR